MAFNVGSFLPILFAIVATVYGDTKRCPTDIALLVDQSTSITRIMFKSEIIPFLTSLIHVLDVGKDGDHVSLIRFSSPDSTGTDFHFGSYYDKTAVLNAVSSMGFDGGNTATVAAIKITHDNFFTSDASGARTDKYSGGKVAPIAIVITDGIATDGDAAAAAEVLRKKGVTIFAIAVGPVATDDYLEEIAGDKSRVFQIYDPEKFTDKLMEVIKGSTNCS